MIHILKIEPEYLDNLLSGRKKSEVRLNDRDYQVEDILELRQLGIDKAYNFKITHIHSGYGVKEGFVILSVEHVTPIVTKEGE